MVVEKLWNMKPEGKCALVNTPRFLIHCFIDYLDVETLNLCFQGNFDQISPFIIIRTEGSLLIKTSCCNIAISVKVMISYDILLLWFIVLRTYPTTY